MERDGGGVCPSDEVHLQSGVTPRDGSSGGADGSVREITPCRDAAPSIYFGTPFSNLAARHASSIFQAHNSLLPVDRAVGIGEKCQ